MGEQAGPAEAVGAGQHHGHVQPAQADGALIGCRLALPHPLHALRRIRILMWCLGPVARGLGGGA